MKNFHPLLAIPLLLIFVVSIQEKTRDAFAYELVCNDTDVDSAVDNLKKKITYWTIEVVQNPGSINSAKTNKNIIHTKEQIKCLADTEYVRKVSFIFEGEALNKEEAVAGYQRESDCFSEVTDTWELSMKTTLSHIYFDEEFWVDRRSLIGADKQGTEYKCELNDLSDEYAL